MQPSDGWKIVATILSNEWVQKERLLSSIPVQTYSLGYQHRHDSILFDIFLELLQQKLSEVLELLDCFSVIQEFPETVFYGFSQRFLHGLLVNGCHKKSHQCSGCCR